MKQSFIKLQYTKSLQVAKNYLKYSAFREREGGEEYGLFGPTSDHVNVKSFASVLDDPLTSHPKVAVAHNLIISMSGHEWKRSNFTNDDYRMMVRDLLDQWATHNQYDKIEWAASIHTEEGHPHVHVVLKATYYDIHGVQKRLFMSNKDLDWLKKEFKTIKDQTRGFVIDQRELERDLERHRQNEQKHYINPALDAFLFQIGRQLSKEEYRENKRYRKEWDKKR